MALSRSSRESVSKNPLLTNRENQVVRLVAQGRRNREVAQKLSISEKTVKNHLWNIFNKLGIDNRVELAFRTMNHALLP
jgi:two-component system nitrate/nitrite response regulator NarL